MFIRTVEPSNIEVIWNSYFTHYRDNILSSHYQVNDNEDMFNKDNNIYKIMYYYLAFYLVLLVYLEIQDRVHSDWSYYVNKYDLINQSKIFGCNGISLDKVFELFGIDYNNTGGIGNMQIDSTFQVDSSDSAINSSVEFQDLLNNMSGCNNQFTC